MIELLLPCLRVFVGRHVCGSNAPIDCCGASVDNADANDALECYRHARQWHGSPVTEIGAVGVHVLDLVEYLGGSGGGICRSRYAIGRGGSLRDLSGSLDVVVEDSSGGVGACAGGGACGERVDQYSSGLSQSISAVSTGRLVDMVRP